MIKYIETKGRLLFTTDLHGEIGVLQKALHTLGFTEGVDTLVCAGDLIDRGSNSLGTLDFFVNDETGSYHTVVGNHDVFAIENNTEDNGHTMEVSGHLLITLKKNVMLLLGRWLVFLMLLKCRTKVRGLELSMLLSHRILNHGRSLLGYLKLVIRIYSLKLCGAVSM